MPCLALEPRLAPTAAALFIGWGQVVRGREHQALESFKEAMKFSGFVLIRGEADKLARLRQDPEFQRHITRAQWALDGAGVVSPMIGAGLNRLMTMYGEEVSRLEGKVRV